MTHSFPTRRSADLRGPSCFLTETTKSCATTWRRCSAGNSPHCAIEDLLSARRPRLAQLDWHFGELKVPGHRTIVPHQFIFSLQAEDYGRSTGYRKDDDRNSTRLNSSH